MSRRQPFATTGRGIVLVGPACGGKSTVAKSVAERLDLRLVTARAAIEISVGRRDLTGRQLVDCGARLEQERPGEWLAEATREIAGAAPPIIDSVRTEAQLAAVVHCYPRMLTIFLSAPVELRRRRFLARARIGDMDFDELGATAVEQEAQTLGPRCEVVLDSAELSSLEIVERALTAVCSETST